MRNAKQVLGVWNVGAGRAAACGVPWLISGALVLCVVILAGQGQPAPSSQPAAPAAREVRAERFVVVDASGKERARLGMQEDGGVELVVRAKNGQAAAWVAVPGQNDWPIVAVCGRDGRVVGELGLLDQTYPVFILREPSGQRRVALYVSKEDNEARVDVLSKSGKSLSSLRVSKDGVPRMVIRDEEARGRILLVANPDGSCLLDLSDLERPRLRAGVSASGEPALVAFDKDGQPVWWHSTPAAP